ncbi:MAG: methionine--tRNA ligase [Candidatus Rokubacteria bacterium]|nr:methionine--tRNA ligase [Candidatus Rokubacteria bacterium]
MTPETLYLTTPIYYVNARPHLGHACTTIMADAMCRYRRLRGDRVFFLTGTDEHGDRIAQVAGQAGVTPQVFADEISGAFRETWRRLGIQNDDFIRTTEPRHARVVGQILERLWDRGEIYFGEYGGNYCYGCERFYTDKEIVDGKCPDHQTPLTFIKEQNYFFRMSRYQDWLIRYLEEHPEAIQPDRYRNEVLGFLREPLQDLNISRPKTRLEWGITLPFDDRYVTYVWFDALLNYLSALDYPDGERYRELWPHAIHLIGKDILKPHGVYWPTMLKAAGIPIYQGLRVHGYWSLGGAKMSKSVGNVVEAFQLTDTYGHDAFRYFLLREMSFGLDASFSEAAFVGRLNADLANDLGNLVSRATTLIVNFGKGVAPAPGPVADEDRAVREAAERARRLVDAAMEEFAFQKALAAIWELLGVANRYVDSTAPWTLARDPATAPRLGTVLYTLAEALRWLGVLLDAFLPDAAGKIRAAIGAGAPRLADLEWGKTAPGTPVQKVPALFPRAILPASIASPEGAGTPASIQTPRRREPRPAAREGAGPVSIDEFRKIDLRVAEIVAAERLPRSRKLLKLTVKVGEEARTLVAGIAEHYAPEALVGKKVVVVANLEPATLMGVESRGMVLAGSEGSALSLLTLDKELPPGAKVT